MALTVSRILHAGYIFESADARVLVDPLFESPFSRNCFAFPGVEFDLAQIRREKFDAVFISHYHDDHLSFASLDLLDRATPIYLFCVHDEIFALLRELGFSFVSSLQFYEPVRVGSIQITVHPALDRDVDSILEIEAGGVRVLNVVDSWIDPDVFARLRAKKWDLVLWPFQTMRELEVLSPGPALAAEPEIPCEWLEQLSELKVAVIVPSSCQFRFEEWSWMNKVYFPISYAMFEREVGRLSPLAKVRRLNPGHSIHFSHHFSRHFSRQKFEQGANVPWIKSVGPEGADYDFDPSVIIPSTQEIAKNFAPLDTLTFARVTAFCSEEFLRRYRLFDPIEDGFFGVPRVWRLSVFDSGREPAVFHFAIDGARSEAVMEYQGPVDWNTEIVAARLSGAIEDGESLSSMYVRIGETDNLLEDPLLRVLFSGEIGSYQRAQLRKLQA